MSSDPLAWPSSEFSGLDPAISFVDSTYQIHPLNPAVTGIYTFYLLVSIDSGATFYAYPNILTFSIVEPEEEPEVI